MSLSCSCTFSSFLTRRCHTRWCTICSTHFFLAINYTLLLRYFCITSYYLIETNYLLYIYLFSCLFFLLEFSTKSAAALAKATEAENEQCLIFILWPTTSIFNIIKSSTPPPRWLLQSSYPSRKLVPTINHNGWSATPTHHRGKWWGCHGNH